MADKEDKSEKVPPNVKPVINLEQQQEQLLKNKYGNLPKKKGSVLLQKRNQINRAANKKVFFDSGDYMMARNKMQGAANSEGGGDQLKVHSSLLMKAQVTGDHMPTPEDLPRLRKSSQSNLVFPNKK